MNSKNEKLRKLNEGGVLTRKKINEIIRKINEEKNPHEKRKLRSELEIKKLELTLLWKLFQHIRKFE